MNALRLLPVALVLVILAAHFYRAALWVPLGLTVALLPLLFVRAPWAARVLQVALLAGAVEWLRTAAVFIAVRQSMNVLRARFDAITVRGIDCRIREIRPVDGERWRASQRAAGTQESAEPAL